jgi:hypothetical protein
MFGAMINGAQLTHQLRYLSSCRLFASLSRPSSIRAIKGNALRPGLTAPSVVVSPCTVPEGSSYAATMSSRSLKMMSLRCVLVATIQGSTGSRVLLKFGLE